MNALLRLLKRKRSPIHDEYSSRDEECHELVDVVDEQLYFYTSEELIEIDDVETVVTSHPAPVSVPDPRPEDGRVANPSPPNRDNSQEQATPAISEPPETHADENAVVSPSPPARHSSEEDVAPTTSENPRPAASISAFGNVSAFTSEHVSFASLNLSSEELRAAWLRRTQWFGPAPAADVVPGSLEDSSSLYAVSRTRAVSHSPAGGIATSSTVSDRPQPSPFFWPQGPPPPPAPGATSLWSSPPSQPRRSPFVAPGTPPSNAASPGTPGPPIAPSPRAGPEQGQVVQSAGPSHQRALLSSFPPRPQSPSFDRPVRPLPRAFNAAPLGESSTFPFRRSGEAQRPQEHREAVRTDRVAIPSFWAVAQAVRDVQRLHVTLLEVTCDDYNTDSFRPLAILSGAPFPLIPTRGDRYTLDIAPEIRGRQGARIPRVTAVLRNLGDDLYLRTADIDAASQWMSNALQVHTERATPTAVVKWVAIPLRQGIDLEEARERVDRDSFGWREMRYETEDQKLWDPDTVLLDERRTDVCYLARSDAISSSSRGRVVYDTVLRRRSNILTLPGDQVRTFNHEDRPWLRPFFLSASIYRASSALPAVMYNLNETLIAQEASQRLFGDIIRPHIMRRAITLRIASPARIDLTYESLEFVGDRLINFAGVFDDLCKARRYPIEVTGVTAAVVVTNAYLAKRANLSGISSYLRTSTLSDAMSEETGTLLHMSPPRSDQTSPLADKASTAPRTASPEMQLRMPTLMVMQVFADVSEALIAAGFFSEGGSWKRATEVMAHLGIDLRYLNKIRAIAQRSSRLWGDEPPEVTAWGEHIGTLPLEERILDNAFSRYRRLFPGSRACGRGILHSHRPTAFAESRLGRSAIELFIACHLVNHHQHLSPSQLNQKLLSRNSKFAISAFCVTSGLARHLIMTPEMKAYEDFMLQAFEQADPSPTHFWSRSAGQREPPPEFASFISCLFAAFLDDADLDLRPAFNFFNSVMLPWQERFCK